MNRCWWDLWRTRGAWRMDEVFLAVVLPVGLEKWCRCATSERALNTLGTFRVITPSSILTGDYPPVEAYIYIWRIVEGPKNWAMIASKKLLQSRLKCQHKGLSGLLPPKHCRTCPIFANAARDGQNLLMPTNRAKVLCFVQALLRQDMNERRSHWNHRHWGQEKPQHLHLYNIPRISSKCEWTWALKKIPVLMKIKMRHSTFWNTIF